MTDSDSRELQARIAYLKGEIQKRKGSSAVTDSTGTPPPLHQQTHHRLYDHYNTHQQPNYGPLKVFSNKTSITRAEGVKTEEPNDLPRSDWITTPSRNAQIINPIAYNPTAARDRILDPVSKIRKQTQIVRQKLNSGETHDRQLTINGIKYSVHAGGGKLVRIKGMPVVNRLENSTEDDPGSGDGRPTPKQVVISGIPFQRSKNGNLYRSSMIRKKWYEIEHSDRTYLRWYRNSIIIQKKTELCKRFSNTGKPPGLHLTMNRYHYASSIEVRTLLTFDLGTCSLGPKCPYIHDTTKVAICREFLRSGSCSQGQHCDLSHDLTYERVPACVHFVRGGCTKDECPYPHVRVNPAAPVCRLFTTFGYCSKGIECKDKHVFECPDYAQGKCSNPKCRLPHVDRAGQLRQQTSHPTDTKITVRAEEDTDTTVAVKAEDETPVQSGSDIDSEEEVVMEVDDAGFSQEHDFMKF